MELTAECSLQSRLHNSYSLDMGCYYIGSTKYTLTNQRVYLMTFNYIMFLISGCTLNFSLGGGGGAIVVLFLDWGYN